MLDQGTRILVTGANGQVGRELLRALGDRHAVLATVHHPSSAPELAHARAMDLADTKQLLAVLDEFRPEVILNAAAYTAVDAAESNPGAAEATNTVAPAVLAEWAKRHGSALLHYSTDYVFDGSGSQAWRETDPTGPLGVYGRTKLAGEQAIQAAGPTHLILRTSWVYGVWGANFIKKMFELALSRPELKVVDDQIGAPTSARWLAELTRQLIERSEGDIASTFDQLSGLAHAACGGETSWHGFASEIFRQAAELELPVPTPVVHAVPSTAFATAARRPHNSRLNCDRLRSMPGVELSDWQVELARNLPRLHAQFLVDRELMGCGKP